MNSFLENMASTGNAIHREAVDLAEYSGLIRSGSARLHDSHEGFLNVDDLLVTAVINAGEAVLAALQLKEPG